MSHPMDKHIGRRVYLRRTALGMSQEALGKAIGVTFQQVQKYERGANRIGAGNLFDFSKTLRVPVSYFYEEYDKEGFAEDNSKFESELASSRESLALVSAYNKIVDPLVRKRLLSFIKALASETDTND